MTIQIAHPFVSTAAEGTNAAKVRTSNWNAPHDLEMEGPALLGREAADQGAAQEIAIGSGLNLSGNVLSATGGGGGGGVLTPVVLTGNTTLTEASHGNREIEVNSASPVTLTLPATATAGTRFFGTNMGAGAVSIVLDGGGAIPRNALLPATLDQFSAFEVKRQTASFVRVA
jgi:hypothetical protein